MDVTVRQATVADVEGIQRVARDSWHEAHGPIVGADAVEGFLAEHYSTEHLRELVTDPGSIYLVAESAASDLVGFAAALPVEDGGRTWGLGSIYVHPDDWGVGVGRQLLDRIESGVRAEGGERLRLVVMADNDVGIGFYGATGFERAGDHYDENLDVEGYVYAKEL